MCNLSEVYTDVQFRISVAGKWLKYTITLVTNDMFTILTTWFTVQFGVCFVIMSAYLSK